MLYVREKAYLGVAKKWIFSIFDVKLTNQFNSKITLCVRCSPWKKSVRC